MEEVSEIQP